MFEIIGVLLKTIREYTVWLYFTFFEYKLFYFDLWSVAHLWSGAVLFTCFTLTKKTKRWLYVFLSLLAFEILEAILFIAVLKLFQPEKIVDVANDIAIGLLGGIFVFCLFKFILKKPSSIIFFVTFLASITVSFIWTGTYGYNYNIEFFNSPGINWWAFTAWFLSGNAIILFFINIRVKRKYSLLVSAVATWLVYFSLLLGVEFLGYSVFQLRESAHESSPLIFNLIHGSKVMHVFYSTAPLIFIGVFSLLFKLFSKYAKKENPFRDETGYTFFWIAGFVLPASFRHR